MFVKQQTVFFMLKAFTNVREVDKAILMGDSTGQYIWENREEEGGSAGKI